MRSTWLSSLMLMVLLGCGQSSPTPVTNNPPSAASVDEPLSEGTVLVTLKLPEMT